MKVYKNNVLSEDTTTWKEDFEKLYSQEYSKEVLNEDFANSISHMEDSIKSETIFTLTPYRCAYPMVFISTDLTEVSRYFPKFYHLYIP